MQVCYNTTLINLSNPVAVNTTGIPKEVELPLCAWAILIHVADVIVRNTWSSSWSFFYEKTNIQHGTTWK